MKNKKMKQLEEKLYNKVFSKKYIEDIAFKNRTVSFFKGKLPRILYGIENETRIAFRITEPNFSSISKKQIKEKERKEFFFRNFYEHLSTIYQEDYLTNNGEKIITNILNGFTVSRNVQEKKDKAYKLNTLKEEKLREKLGLDYSKLNVLEELKNARPILREDGKIELEVYSKEGLARIVRNVNDDILKLVSTIYLEGKIYKRDKNRYLPNMTQDICLFFYKKDTDKEELIGYGKFVGDDFARQDFYPNQEVLERYLEEPYYMLDYSN